MAMLKKLALPPSSLAGSSHQLVSLLLSNMADKSEVCLRSLRSLLDLQADAVVPVLVGEACQLLGDPQVVRVTQDDMEILATPDGQLWHLAMKKE